MLIKSVTIYRLKLKAKKIVAVNTMALFFQKPKNFYFKAGQFAEFSLYNRYHADIDQISRAFSIASSPEETELMIVFRLRNTVFKNILKNIKVGEEIKMDGPYGSFVLHEDSSCESIFLAGGIGIAPIRSILINSMLKNTSRKIFLFYSNKHLEDAAFFEELKFLQNKDSGYKFIPTMTSLEKSKKLWIGDVGRIQKSLLIKYIPNIKKAIYYLCGSSDMVASLKTVLEKMGIDEDNIRIEEFLGY